MNQTIIQLVQKELSNYRPKQLTIVLSLSNKGNTVPFIARYRREITGSLDEIQIREIEKRYAYLEDLEKRKNEVIRLIDEQGKLTPGLETEITQSVKVQQVEDLYRSYKQRRRTRAMIAKEKGLKPLALWLMQLTDGKVQSETEEYIDKEEEISSAEGVLQGAHEIVAEQVSDNAKFRIWILSYTYNKSMYVSQVKDEKIGERGVYEIYYDFAEPVHKMVSHRALATNRGEKEETLKVFLQVDEAAALAYLGRQLVKNPTSPSSSFVRETYQDSYKRFIQPAIKRKLRNELTEEANEQAVAISGEDLRNLLL